MVYYTREKVLCDFIGCNYNGQRRSLNRHYERIHGGKKPEIRNSAFGSGGRWSSWVGAAGKDADMSHLKLPLFLYSRGVPSLQTAFGRVGIVCVHATQSMKLFF